MPRALPLALAFLLGACATAAVSAVAAPSDTAADPAAAPPLAPRVVAAGAAERRRAPHGAATVDLLLRGHAAFLGRLEMAPGAVVPEHRDPTEEYLYILEGGGDLRIDGVAYPLRPGDAVFMPAGALVTYRNGDRPLVALQVFAGPAPAAKYDAWDPVPAP